MFFFLFGLYYTRSPSSNERQERIPDLLLPRCKNSSCGGLLRPDIVWFNENLNPTVLNKASMISLSHFFILQILIFLLTILDEELDSCDLCLVIGTSSVVYPAAMFAPQVANRGVPVAEFNMETTSATHHFGYK